MITDQFTQSSATYQSPSAGATVPPTVHPANGGWRLRARSNRFNTHSGVDRTFNGQTLGWLSVGLGLGALLAPHALGRLTGLGERTALLRLVGCRELASGLGLLTQPRQAPWLWSRVAGDAMDLAMILSAAGRANPGRARALVTAGVVGAIAAADIVGSVRATWGRAYTQRQGDTSVSVSLVVNKTPQECYDFWRSHSHPERKITADVPGSHIGWRSADESDVEHAGVVRFHPATGGRGTVVRLVMRGPSTAGGAGGPLAKLMSKGPRFEITEELRRFKQLLETGEIATTRGQPSGRRSLLGSRLPSGRLSRQGKL